MSTKKLRVQPKFTRAIKMGAMKHHLKMNFIMPKSRLKEFYILGTLGIYYPRMTKSQFEESDLN